MKVLFLFFLYVLSILIIKSQDKTNKNSIPFSSPSYSNNLSRYIQANNITNSQNNNNSGANSSTNPSNNVNNNNISNSNTGLNTNQITTNSTLDDDNSADNTPYGKMVNYCNSLNETINPKILDCTAIDIHCCFANYTIMSYYFTTCFYNENKDNTIARSYFEDAIGSISNSPFMEFTVKCSTRNVTFSYVFFILTIIIYLR